MDQHVDSCLGPDGEEIAYAVVGDGPPLVLAAWWTSHLELDWQNPELRGFVEALAAHHTVVRYDRPGVGMSGRDGRSYDLATEAGHLEAVVEAAADGPVDLLGISCGGPPVVALAIRRPELVGRIAFFGSYADGSAITDDDTRDALVTLVRANWGLGSTTLTGIFLPEAHPSAASRFTRSQRLTADAGVAADLLRLTFDMEVAEAASRLEQPVLVMHRTGDQVIGVDRGRDLAERIPDAEFCELPGRAHLPWAEHPREVVAALEGFLTGSGAAEPPVRMLTTAVSVGIVDGSAMLADLGRQSFRQRLDALRELLEREAGPRGGRLVRAGDDGALLTFDLPGEALAFAPAVREQAGRMDLSLRFGLHTGEVEVRDGDVAGRTVVVAARLCDAAQPGAVLTTATTVELAVGRAIHTEAVGPLELGGLPGPVDVHEVDPAGAPRPPGPSVPAFVRDGSWWHIAWGDTEATVRHSKGVGDLATLCAAPGREVPAAVLMDGGTPTARPTGEEVLDREAIAAYRDRLGAIEAELDAADASGDAERSAALDSERDAIVEALRAATGLGGRTRRMGDDVERARKAVTGRIRDAIARIGDADPALGAHLAEHVRTGRSCAYEAG